MRTYGFTFAQSFSTATAASESAESVGTVADCALAGRPYMIDRIQQGDARYRVETIPLAQKYYTFSQQADTNVGERTLNPEDYWRISRESAHLGAGQAYFDRSHSDKARFHASKGIDCWTPGQITLLPATFHRLTSANADLYMAVLTDLVYTLDGNTLRYLSDVSAGSSGSTAVTADGTSAALSSPTSIASDGTRIFVVDGTRTNYTTSAASTFGKYHTSDHPASVVRVCKGRLLTIGASTNKYKIYTHDTTAGSATATAYFSHLNTSWIWTDACAGPAAIYFVGHAGDHSAIWSATVKADGSGLDVPKEVLSLPYGEVATNIFAYLSVLVIGTTKGVRIAAMAADGSLALGDLIELPAAPTCFEAQDRFVWFGWTNYDGDSTGIGRLDLANFNGTTPAYATDLMASVQGAVQGVVSVNDRLVFSVSGSGLWAQDDTYVSSGTLTSGAFNFGLVESKVYMRTTVSYRTGDGTFRIGLAVDGAATYAPTGATVDTSVGLTDVAFPAGQTAGRDFELELTMTPPVDLASTPVIARITAMANPAPERRMKIIVPLLFAKTATQRSGKASTLDVLAERANIEALWQSSQVTTYQEPGRSYSVTVDDFQWYPYEPTSAGVAAEDGTAVVVLKVVS